MSAVRVSRRDRNRGEERANVVNEQFGQFHRGEVTPARHLGPSLDVEKPFGPFTSV
jgi:hypothetical protein